MSASVPSAALTWVSVPEIVRAAVPEPVTVGETDGVCEGVDENEGVPEDVSVCVDDPDFEGVSEGVSLPLAPRVTGGVTVALCVGVTVLERAPEGVGV